MRLNNKPSAVADTTIGYYQNDIMKMKLRILDWFVETGDIVPNRKDPRF